MKPGLIGALLAEWRHCAIESIAAKES